MEPSEFNSIIEKKGGKSITWGYILWLVMALVIGSMLIFIEIDDTPLGSYFLENFF